jgi:peptidoglycan/xylan/chitin deacetylase (PgdA/CDA1 family)
VKKSFKKLIIFLIAALVIIGLAIAAFTMLFDQVVIVRRGTIYHIDESKKVVALTFDDGPSPIWTPKILDELKKADVKATFFMLGEHVGRYPEIARRVAEEGHEIGNHTYDHNVLIYYKTDELEKEIRDTEKLIKNITGQTTRYFRPPKAWLTDMEKRKIEQMGYKIVLWNLNSKDWVTFDDKYIIKYILRHIRPGDIILFHDSGGVFTAEGGDRHETVRTIPELVEKLKERGYQFVTITELLNIKSNDK